VKWEARKDYEQEQEAEPDDGVQPDPQPQPKPKRSTKGNGQARQWDLSEPDSKGKRKHLLNRHNALLAFQLEGVSFSYDEFSYETQIRGLEGHGTALTDIAEKALWASYAPRSIVCVAGKTPTRTRYQENPDKKRICQAKPCPVRLPKQPPEGRGGGSLRRLNANVPVITMT
jgi:hypothetical protein